MKKIIFTVFLIFISYNVTSQITKENWMIGGSGSYNYQKTKSNNGLDRSFTFIDLNSNISYFIKDKWAVGGVLSFQNFNGAKSYGFGAMTRYYFLEAIKMINIFTEAYYKHAINHGDLTSNIDYFGLKFGQVTFLTSNVGLEFSLAYQKNFQDNSTGTNFILGIGFQIHLERK